MPSGYRTEKSYKIAEFHRRAILDLFADRFESPKFQMDYDCVDGLVERTTAIGMQEYYAEKFGVTPYQAFGTQEVDSMGNWYDAERVKKDIPKVLIVRNGIIPDISDLGETVILPDGFPPEFRTLSSTEIRENVRNTIFN